jgi:hypothetical protein
MAMGTDTPEDTRNVACRPGPAKRNQWASRREYAGGSVSAPARSLCRWRRLEATRESINDAPSSQIPRTEKATVSETSGSGKGQRDPTACPRAVPAGRGVSGNGSAEAVEPAVDSAAPGFTSLAGAGSLSVRRFESRPGRQQATRISATTITRVVQQRA